MRAGEWKVRLRMIECSGFPRVGGVAFGAIVVELPCDMIRFCGGIFVLMTGVAIRECDIIVAVDMAFLASSGYMRTGQSEFCRGVIER